MCFASKAGEGEVNVGGVGADAKFLFKGVDDEYVSHSWILEREKSAMRKLKLARPPARRLVATTLCV